MRVLVTGGAKRIGAAIARAVASAGHVPIIHYGRSRDEAVALAAELGGAAVHGDLADLVEVPALFARAAEGGPIDALVNSASRFEEDRPERIDTALATRLHAINCVAPCLLAATLAAQGRDGVVVNLLDQKLANPNPDYFSYSLSKHALAGATVMMAQAYAPRVRVNAVAPGLTLPSADQTQAEFEVAGSRNLLERTIGADQVAAAVVYLLEAKSVTGQTLWVDAGQRFCTRTRDVMFDRNR